MIFKRLSLLSLFFAWACASGALLDTTQVFAWARMAAGYARTMSLEEAAARTFDPGKPCAICQAVNRAREATQDAKQPAAAPTLLEKLLLAHVAAEPFVFSPPPPDWPSATPARAVSWFTSVPVPPPRTERGSSLG